MEMSVIGQWFLQFKKYMPTIIKQQFISRRKDGALGTYVPVVKADGKIVQDEGLTVYRWEQKLNEGRVNVALNLLMSTLGQKDLGYVKDSYL
jgi:hypothetical protein